MIKGPFDFMTWSPSSLVTILASVVVINTDSGDIMSLVCHVISEDYVIKGSCDFVGSIP